MAVLPSHDARRLQVASGIALLFGMAAYLPGFFTLPAVDRDEARFAQTSQQMAHADSWEAYIVPQIQDRLRLNKPPLSYWLQAAATRAVALGSPTPGGAGEVSIWPYRLPSLLAAIAAVLVTAHLGQSMFGAPAGWLGAALLASTPLVAWEARQARADELLLALTVTAQAAAWSVWSARHRASSSRRVATIFWVAIGLGMLTKGPITPAIAVLTVVGQSVRFGEWRWMGKFQPWLGVGILALLLSPWTLLVAQRVGWHLYLTTLQDEIIGRSLIAKEGHWGLPGYHLTFLLILFWPGWLLAPALVATIGRWTRDLIRRQPNGATAVETPEARTVQEAQAFCVAWALPAWLCFELVQTKLPHYPLPLYPPLALLTGAAIVSASPGATFKKLGGSVWRVVGALLVVGVPLGIWIGGSLTSQLWPTLLTLAATLAGGVLVAAAARALRRERLVDAILLAVVALVIAETTVCALLPRATRLWLAPRLMALVAAADPTHRRPLAAVDYHEDSLIFASGGRAQRIFAPELAAWLRAHPDGLAIIPSALRDGAGDLRTLGEVEGFNYSKGEWLRLRLIENVPPPTASTDAAPRPRTP